MKRRRVKITGIGFVTPVGVGKQAFLDGIQKSQSHVRPITRFDPAAGPFVAAEVAGFDLRNYVPEVLSLRLPRHTQFALAAASLALRDAGLDVSEIAPLSPLIVVGTSLMDSDVINKTIENVVRRGPRFGLKRVIYQGPVSSIAGAIAQWIKSGRTLSLQSACCAGSDAIGHAAGMVASGETDIAICGGTEAPLYYHPMLELKMAGLSPDTADRPQELSRPFDLWRTTGVIGEGACILVLEPEASPRPGYAFVSGYAFATDGSDQPAEGLREAGRLCLANANLHESEIDHISAWGPGHREIDMIEARVLREIFGSFLDGIAVASIKGALGNPLGAAGAIQAGCAALSIREGFIPPTVNWQYSDPDCRLNLSSRTRYSHVRTALVNSHGLSGTNSCLVLRRCE
jgi:3-oxoacyl-[acyl-carrier-protein] synthase II